MAHSVYHALLQTKQSGAKRFALLIDPDQVQGDALRRLGSSAEKAGVDYLFVGGSLLIKDEVEECLTSLRSVTEIPLVLFPGSIIQVNEAADALLFLSLISGRNADLLIGQQVVAAPLLAKSSLEIISTGYMLIDGGMPTTASYISGTAPIPADKPSIAACTALAGAMLGLKLMYLDAGSGAKSCVSPQMVKAVSQQVSCPLIVGGGIRCSQQAADLAKAGADVIVVGNAIEKDPTLLPVLAAAVQNTMHE